MSSSSSSMAANLRTGPDSLYRWPSLALPLPVRCFTLTSGLVLLLCSLLIGSSQGPTKAHAQVIPPEQYAEGGYGAGVMPSGMVPPMMGMPMGPQELYDPYMPYTGPEAVAGAVVGLVGSIVNTAMHAANSRHQHRPHHQHGYRAKRQATSSPYMLAGNISLGYGDPAQHESGPWEEWSPLSECSRACGGGVQFQTRVCRERNYDGSQTCVGASKRYFSCNIEKCPPGTVDFREDQCSRFDAAPFEGRYYNWIPYTRVPNPCELNCRPREYSDDRRFYYRQARRVLDGTPCYYNQTDHPLDVCVGGVCVELGCDLRLGSYLREDKCRVCGGNGRSCRTVQGRYSQNDGLLPNAYNDILLIPAGATNIVIREVGPTRNYLALRNAEGVYYLNGDWKIQPPAAFSFAGTTFFYERALKHEPSQPEEITAKGPTNEKLVVVLLVQEGNRGVDYEYSVPFSEHQVPSSAGISPTDANRPATGADGARTEEKQHYAWIFGDYGECSRTCGTGVQKREVFCALILDGGRRREPVVDTLCESTMRPANTRTCSQAPCLASWRVGNWSECSCVHRVARRAVYCSNGQEAESAGALEEGVLVLPDHRCQLNGTSGSKPVELKECTPVLDKCPQWIAGEWSECSAGKCGVGVQRRPIQCGRKIASATVTTTEQTKLAALKAEESTTTTTEEPKEELAIQKRDSEAAAEDAITTAAPTTEVSVSADDVTTTTGSSDAVVKKVEEPKELFEYLDPVLCDQTLRPQSERPCAQRVCDNEGGLEWLVSDWTPTSCEELVENAHITRQVRHVLCATRNGTIYPDELCATTAGRGEKPSTSKPCSATEAAVSPPVWFTSEWTECNATCGVGHRTRTVFCGHAEGVDGIKKEEDPSKCLHPKPTEFAGCAPLPACSNVTFIGPLGPCSLPCGGGQRNRSAMCFTQTEELPGVEVMLKLVAHDEECHGKASGMKTSEQCNIEACDDDEVAAVLECKDTPFGCCPNEISVVADKDLANCPPMVANETNGIECDKSTWGCCPSKTPEDESVQALGPFALGCPIDCNNTRYGCCPDNVTMMASSGRVEECPPVPCRGEDECNPTTTTLAPTTTTTQAPTTIPPNLPSLPPAPNSNALVADDDLEGSGDSTGDSNGLKIEDNIEGSGDDGEQTGVFTTIKSIIGSITTLMPPVDKGEQNCNLTEFGCCPTGKKAASGLNYFGCSCDDYPYGCCQDRYTAATGPNYEGCVCASMLYGCCSDKKTPASGPNQDGCGCDTTAHGCCPDMVAIAQGPNFHGCPCESLEYGCCPNSQIPARGPNFVGCTCIESPHGCCPDGQTVALGPNFEGCPSGPPLDLKLQSEVCGLAKEVGSCRNFSVKWFFDSVYGDCNRFWYGGCEGNANRFSSQELCQRACVKPEGPERCSLPAITGPCNASEVAYYFDATRRQCAVFTYGGCLGNTNRFPSLEACQLACLYEEKTLDLCDQPMSPGPCQGQYRRWYYRREEGRCREFSYGGCQGNANNFQTEESCRTACASKTPFEVCSLPKATGPCLGNFPRWHFDLATGVCREFTYTGCQGNRNRFVDRESCERMCNQTIPYYHRGGGAASGGENEPAVAINEVIDRAPQPSVTYESVCILPKAQGSCRALVIQWYFNSASRRCEQFYYGGCEGNANRFDDRESCEAMCLAPYAGGASYPQDPCLEPKDPGPCQNPTIRYYYNTEDRRCHRFYYSGCGGSRNQFATENECISRCEARIGSASSASVDPTDEPTSVVISKFKVDYCFRPLDSGSCSKNILKWYYDKRDGVCKEFYYGGCGGNENRFESQAHCVQLCYNSQDICRLPKVRGPCKRNFTQWYYNDDSNECQEFEFSGCEGNANRFSSYGECEMHCKSGRGANSLVPAPTYPGVYQSGGDGERPAQPPQCQLAPDRGPCRGYYQHWYYQPGENQCQTFIYGGCGGNANRFDEREDCEATCLPRQTDDEHEHEKVEGTEEKEVICRLPYDQGRCKDTQARWYYDSGSHSCFPFAYGGCEGNQNRFRSYERCISFCRGVMSTELSSHPVQQPQQPTGSGYYHPDYSPPQAKPSYPYPGGESIGAQPPLVDAACQPMECSEESCVLGIDHYNDNRGCPVCRCTNPCNDQQCPEGMQCSVELFRDESGQARGRAECRLQNKPAPCPRDAVKYTNVENAANVPYCADQCRNDADCRQMDKCCNNGCANVCLEPEAGSYDPALVATVSIPIGVTYNYTGPKPRPIQPAEQDIYRTDQDSRQDGVRAWNDVDAEDENEDEDEAVMMGADRTPSSANTTAAANQTLLERSVRIPVGEDALLACPIESPAAADNTTVTWSKDGLPIGSRPNDRARFGLATNGSLSIRSVTPEDAGTYACNRPVPTHNETGGVGYVIETRYVQLLVNYSVRIKPNAAHKVIGRVGGSVRLRCSVQGSPPPNITWTKDGQSLKLDQVAGTSVDAGELRKYKLSRQNQTLTVRGLVDKDQGFYSCRAFNGIGKAANVQVQVLLDARSSEPEIVPFNRAMFNRPDQTSTTHGGGQRVGNFSAHWVNEQRPSSLDRIRASIQVLPRDYRVGSTLQLDCLVQSQITGQLMSPPEVNILWYVPKSGDIPMVVDASNEHHYRLLANQTLMVFNLAKTDSGLYRCRANSKPTVESIASVNIQVDDFHVPDDCHDSPFFRQCAQIVKARYCSNEQYRKFCCRSCFLAEMSGH